MGYSICPPLFAIYLLLISDVISAHLKKHLRAMTERKRELNEHYVVVLNVALSWSLTVGVINSAFAAIISVVSVFLWTGNAPLAVSLLVVLILIFTPLAWKVFTFEPGEMTTVEAFEGWRWSVILKLVLVVVNLVLVVAVLSPQIWPAVSQTSQNPQAPGKGSAKPQTP